MPQTGYRSQDVCKGGRHNSHGGLNQQPSDYYSYSRPSMYPEIFISWTNTGRSIWNLRYEKYPCLIWLCVLSFGTTHLIIYPSAKLYANTVLLHLSLLDEVCQVDSCEILILNHLRCNYLIAVCFRKAWTGSHLPPALPTLWDHITNMPILLCLGADSSILWHIKKICIYLYFELLSVA